MSLAKTNMAVDVNPMQSMISVKTWNGSTWFAVVFLTFIVIFWPLFFGSFWLKTFTLAACYTLASAGIAVIYARLGQVSLVQVALVGVGGWTALRVSFLGLPFELSMLTGGIVTGFIGLLIGLPALRMRGLYLALVTLMAAGGAEIMFNATRFPNGGDGFFGLILSNPQVINRPFYAQSDGAFFRFVVITVALGCILIGLHRRGKPGRAWALIRRSEACAMAAGVNVTLYKTWAFTLGGFLAGISGGLLAGTLRMLDPLSFKASGSIMLFAITVVGGAYSWIGQVIAGLLFKVVPTLFNEWGVDGDIASAIFGAALLHALITAPEGLAGQLIGTVRSVLKRVGK